VAARIGDAGEAKRSSGIDVRVVGCGDAFGSGGRFNTCFLLDGPEGRALIDCGASSLIALKALGIDPDTIGTIAITHLHGDHFGGLVFLLREATLYNRRTLPLLIAGPPGLRARLEQALEIFFPTGSAPPKTFALSFVELEARATKQVGPIRITAFAADHFSGDPSYSLRVEMAGRTVAYTGDTLWVDDLEDLAAGADLLICEAYSHERPRGKHLDYMTIKRRLPALGAARLLLTHLGEEMIAMIPELDLPVAHDGQLIRLD